MKRRSFLQTLAGIAGIVALAPQLAFRAKPIVVEVTKPFTLGPNEMSAFWCESSRWSSCYTDEYIQFMTANANRLHAVILPTDRLRKTWTGSAPEASA